MEDRRLERSTSCQILAWSRRQKRSIRTFQKLLRADMAHVWRELHTTVRGFCLADSFERTSRTRVPELKVNPARGAPYTREIGVHTSAPLVWWRRETSSWRHRPEGSPGEERRLQGKQKANARAGTRRNPAKRSGKRGNGRRSGAGSDLRRAHEALCTTRVAREPRNSESVQLHRFFSKGKAQSFKKCK